MGGSSIEGPAGGLILKRRTPGKRAKVIRKRRTTKKRKFRGVWGKKNTVTEGLAMLIGRGEDRYGSNNLEKVWNCGGGKRRPI